MPLSWMESGPSVRWLFAGAGISDCRCVLPLVVVVAVPCDVVVDVVVVDSIVVEVVLVVAPVVVVLEFGELLQADATRPMAIAAAARA
jgi:hypothetical protein